jgi:hypothetical protein
MLGQHLPDPFDGLIGPFDVGREIDLDESLIGPVPAGMVLDHLCHTLATDCIGGPRCQHRRCVNPAHLVDAGTQLN